MLLLSAWLRIGIGLGVVALMSAKPGLGGLLIILGGAAFLGFATGLAAGARRRRTLSVATNSADS